MLHCFPSFIHRKETEMKRLLVVFAVLALFVVMPSPVIAEGPSVQASFNMPPHDPFRVPLNIAPLNWERHYRILGTGTLDRPLSGTSSAQPTDYTGTTMSAQVTVMDDGFRLALDWERSRIASVRIDSEMLYQPKLETLDCIALPCSPKLVQRIDDRTVADRIHHDAFSLGISYDPLKDTKNFVLAPGIGVQLWSVRVVENTEYTKARMISPVIGFGPTRLEILQHDVNRNETTLNRFLPFLSIDGQCWPWGKHHSTGLVLQARYIAGSASQDPTASSLTETYAVPIRQNHWQGRVGLAVAF